MIYNDGNNDADPISSIALGMKIEANLNAWKRVFGDEWPQVVAEQQPSIETLMEKDDISNPIKAVTPVATAMCNDGEDGSILLAVAAQMILDKQ